MSLRLPRSYAVIFNIVDALRAEFNEVEATPPESLFEEGINE